MEKKNDVDCNDYYYYFNMCLYEYFAIYVNRVYHHHRRRSVRARACVCVFTMLCWKYEFFLPLKYEESIRHQRRHR